jgi:hypothetical protein
LTSALDHGLRSSRLPDLEVEVPVRLHWDEQPLVALLHPGVECSVGSRRLLLRLPAPVGVAVKHVTIGGD